MASEPLILSDARLLAEFMHESEFKSFFEKRFSVPPEYAALLFKNGEMIDAYKGAHFSVGGLVNQIKSIVGGSSHISMLLADMRPFSIQSNFEAKSRDNVDVIGVVTFELQVNPDKPSNILGFMTGVTRNTDQTMEFSRKGLSKADMLERIRPHLSDRVFEAALSRVDATEIRGNTGLQDKIQADIMTETERILGNLGMLVNSVSVEWATNAAEKEEQARADALRQQDEIDFQITIARRNAERINDSTEFEIKSNLDIEKLKNASEDELKMMALNSEITFIDAREEAKRRQEIEELDHQIKFLKLEQGATFENALATARHAVDLREIQQKQQKLDLQMKSAREAQEREARKSGALNEQEILRITQANQREHIQGLDDIRLRTRRIESEITLAEERERNKNQMEMLKEQGKLTPEQLMILNPNMSAEVASVLVAKEQARAAAANPDQAVMERMLNMAERQNEQLMDMHRTGMQGAVGVAAGAGGNPNPQTVGAPDENATVDCPQCSTTVKATAQFCHKCGYQLRA